jgi:hypothetical protein
MSIKYISDSNKKFKKEKKEHFINGVLLFINDPLPDETDINVIKKQIEKNVPKRLFQNLDYIYIGNFPELKLRDVQSAYMRGAIYITNENQTNQGLYNAIVHELAHSIETTFASKIYNDNEVAAEFVGKRKKLRSILKTQGIEYKDPMQFIRIEYDPGFDNFLHKEIGYDLLNQLCVGLFSSPYGATSLREYFANGFEHFYLNDREYLQKISPKLYSKILSLTSK